MSDEIFSAVYARPKRRQGITGQTIDAQMRGTICQITELELEELRDELARLRAEVERLKADGQRIMNEAVKMLNEDASDYNRKTNAMIERHADQVAQLTAALSDERAHADALASFIDGGNRQLALISRKVKVTDPMTLTVTKGQLLAAIEAKAAHRARRQG
ncbi:hypothetical protein [Paracoccus versutus]|uniref:Uncharacterized protein n=1 Tax=Paracoccus versutus TaxID=34007 RepID=A0A3D9XU14_PARVE|nr:hypothetical protein [Paracoccus versutus]REF70419.1 hypothetical protein BDD41_3151 [Paracoccus versutus]WGR57276.1 hypothetical protein E3U25_14830 [Paracoccus versutus]